MHVPNSDVPSASSCRRQFCLAACAAAAWTALPVGAEPPPAEPPLNPRRVTAETRASLPKGTIKDYRKPAGFFLIADDRGIYALSSVCTHRGCTVHLEGNSGFGCPCHDSEYDLQGTVTQGPAERPLKHFEVSEQEPGGVLIVDLAKPVGPLVRL